ncbi:hypothetical protein KUCAC02_018092 [Xyrichtys novacula]|uniref:Uncharacterized protein n=1 Tax=Xyrichtys novacula TaxID=13765 RepID=A0AAV1GDJ3_XYRNO|nr:hypothetical protein KUCAC02_018092 [Xyrichtys novacula]
MTHMNQTFLLLSRCRQLLEDAAVDMDRPQINETFSNITENPLSRTNTTSSIPSSRGSDNNAYFYILFVMVFYSVLAMALFKCLGSDEDEKKDPYEEFMSTGKPSTQKFNADHMEEKFDFEEESSL